MSRLVVGMYVLTGSDSEGHSAAAVWTAISKIEREMGQEERKGRVNISHERTTT